MEGGLAKPFWLRGEERKRNSNSIASKGARNPFQNLVAHLTNNQKVSTAKRKEAS